MVMMMMMVMVVMMMMMMVMVMDACGICSHIVSPLPTNLYMFNVSTLAYLH